MGAAEMRRNYEGDQWWRLERLLAVAPRRAQAPSDNRLPPPAPTARVPGRPPGMHPGGTIRHPVACPQLAPTEPRLPMEQRFTIDHAGGERRRMTTKADLVEQILGLRPERGLERLSVLTASWSTTGTTHRWRSTVSRAPASVASPVTAATSFPTGSAFSSPAAPAASVMSCSAISSQICLIHDSCPSPAVPRSQNAGWIGSSTGVATCATPSG